MTEHAFFATCSRGVEAVLADELRELGARDVTPGRGGVAFEGELEAGYRACMGSRTASRVLLPLATFEASSAEALYEGVHAIRWTDHVGPERTLAVDVAGLATASGPGETHFVALKTKDAIVDRVRAKEGARPSVDKRDPDVRVNVHLAGAKVSVSIDLAGRGLHRRGVERAGGAAPLKESLAAALLRIAGWHARWQTGPLVDPMCGSGTLAIEAAWMALDVAPGLARERIGAEGWRAHDASLWSRIVREAEERRDAARAREVRIFARDASPSAVELARTNAARAGVARVVEIARTDLSALEPPPGPPGLLVTNPPYGERLGEPGELGPLYETLGDVLRRRFPGWTAFVLSGNRALDKRVGLRAARRHVVYNGPIECRFLELPISATAPKRDEGPGWRRPSPEAEMFANRLRKNQKKLAQWSKREDVHAYRIYDADIPEYNVAIDWYDGAVRVEEYHRPRHVDAGLADKRLRDALTVASEVLGVPHADVVLRVRRRRGPDEQAERFGDAGELREVRESGLVFLVNLEDYLDTGLFLDDRLLRARVRALSYDKDFLNLFAHTCTATVAAAAGGARSTTSVDLSRRYLDWGRRNLARNGFTGEAHELIDADVVGDLARPARRRFDLILLAPPTRSRSKRMEGDLDVQRDHVSLVERSAERLAPNGELLFTTNLRTFELDARALERAGLDVEEITEALTPADFRRNPRMRAFRIRR